MLEKTWPRFWSLFLVPQQVCTLFNVYPPFCGFERREESSGIGSRMISNEVSLVRMMQLGKFERALQTVGAADPLVSLPLFAHLHDKKCFATYSSKLIKQTLHLTSCSFKCEVKYPPSLPTPSSGDPGPLFDREYNSVYVCCSTLISLFSSGATSSSCGLTGSISWDH